jgi:YVTN family beta-propeller protein
LRSIPVALLLLASVATIWTVRAGAPKSGDKSPLVRPNGTEVDRRRAPVDVALSPDGDWLVVINQKANSAQLIRTSDRKVVDEMPVGAHPTSVAFCPQAKRVVLSERYAGSITLLQIAKGRLQREATIDIGMEPYGVAISPDGATAYVARGAAHDVACVDLATHKVTAHIPVGRWPQRLAVSPNGARLAVADAGDGAITVVDTKTHKALYQEKFKGLNLGHLQIDAAGKHVYFPRLFYGDNPSNVGNIRRGWVIASRIGRIGLEGERDRAGMSLDPRGRAVGDPHGLAITPDETQMIVSAAGTHELLVIEFDGLPMIGIGGSDHIDEALLADRKRFGRIELGGRPMGLCVSPDSRTAYIANELLGCVQVVDLESRTLSDAISLGEQPRPSPKLAEIRLGEALFYDATLCLDQWYSCHSCHQDGGSNIQSMDTLNDGSTFTFKTVLPLYRVGKTAPWTWHGIQPDLRASVEKSITTTMRGPQPDAGDVAALTTYIKTLEPPPNPHRLPDGSLSEAAERGKRVFHSAKAGCAVCHSGPEFTDGEIHDVGLGRDDDRYDGFNTPTLLGAYRKSRLLHHGYAHSLEDLLSDLHNPEKVTGEGALTPEEQRDLIEYLKSL